MSHQNQHQLEPPIGRSIDTLENRGPSNLHLGVPLLSGEVDDYATTADLSDQIPFADSDIPLTSPNRQPLPPPSSHRQQLSPPSPNHQRIPPPSPNRLRLSPPPNRQRLSSPSNRQRITPVSPRRLPFTPSNHNPRDSQSTSAVPLEIVNSSTSTPNSSELNIFTERARKRKRSSDGQNTARLCAIFIDKLASGADLKSVESVHCHVVYSMFEKEFELPDANYFIDVIGKKAQENVNNKLLAQGLKPFLYVKTTELKKQIFAISFVVTERNNLLCLNSTTLPYDPKYIPEKEILFDPNFKKNFESFCDASVEKFASTYGRFAMYVIHDSKIPLSDKRKGPGNRTYYLVNCCSTLLYRLRFEHKEWSYGGPRHLDGPTEEEGREIINDYHTAVDKLENEISNASLGEGIQKVIKFLDEYPRVLNVSLTSIICKSLRPVQLGSNFLNPRFKGQSFLGVQCFRKMAFDRFLYEALPHEALCELGEYEENIGDFQAFNEVILDDSQRYWNIQMRKHPDLSNFALQLAAIPAILPETDFVKILKIIPNYVNKPELQEFAMTLIANEKVKN